MDDYIKRKNAVDIIDRFEGYLDSDMIWRIKFALEHHVPSEDVLPVTHREIIYLKGENND